MRKEHKLGSRTPREYRDLAATIFKGYKPRISPQETTTDSFSKNCDSSGSRTHDCLDESQES